MFILGLCYNIFLTIKSYNCYSTKNNIMGNPRTQKLTLTEDGSELFLSEDNILYGVSNSTSPSHTDITYIVNKNRKLTREFSRQRSLIVQYSENLIEVTINGVSTLINASRISHYYDVGGVANIVYNEIKNRNKILVVGETSQEVKNKIDLLGDLAESQS